MEEQAANNQLDIEYTNPPPYSSSADNLPVVESAIQTEVPATYHGSSTQNIDPQRLASKTALEEQVQSSRVIYSQPQSVHRPVHRDSEKFETAANTLLKISISCCIVCFFCATPLTLFCFLPAIFLSVKAVS